MDGSVGDKLREARTRRKLSLAEIEAATKIRGRYLQAIENDDWEQLPGDTYTRAFIRTYGGFLGLDGDRLAEEQRQHSGATRPAERLPRVDPRPRPVRRRQPGSRLTLSPKLVAGVVTALVVVALLVVGLSTGGSGNGGAAPESRRTDKTGTGHGNAQRRHAAPAGHSLLLAAKAEVWVCLLNGKGNPLVNGAILAAGESEGPFRSGSFTLALGNGAVTMTVDGNQQRLPEPSSPIGFAVKPDGSVHELPEGERPTCT
ncbi:MAG TPA: helix-turn-helix transcriptional regulator [Solirubrobacterales bacterium]|nr:helix-turn-helix transcriptional regulator [Solirubrobacterales bacterium]